VAEGTNGVKVETPIALLAASGEDPKNFAASVSKPVAAAAAAPSGAAAHSAPNVPAASHAAAQAPGGRIFASPLARRIAKEHNVDLSRVAGSGPSGRILKADVEAATRAGTAAHVPGLRPRPAPPGRTSRTRTRAA